MTCSQAPAGAAQRRAILRTVRPHQNGAPHARVADRSTHVELRGRQERARAQSVASRMLMSTVAGAVRSVLGVAFGWRKLDCAALCCALVALGARHCGQSSAASRAATRTPHPSSGTSCAARHAEQQRPRCCVDCAQHEDVVSQISRCRGGVRCADGLVQGGVRPRAGSDRREPRARGWASWATGRR